MKKTLFDDWNSANAKDITITLPTEENTSPTKERLEGFEGYLVIDLAGGKKVAFSKNGNWRCGNVKDGIDVMWQCYNHEELPWHEWLPGAVMSREDARKLRDLLNAILED